MTIGWPELVEAMPLGREVTASDVYHRAGDNLPPGFTLRSAAGALRIMAEQRVIDRVGKCRGVVIYRRSER